MKEILKGAHLDSDGGTKMHTAIRRALDSVEPNLSKEEEAYLICLTDGDSYHDDGKLFELLAWTDNLRMRFFVSWGCQKQIKRNRRQCSFDHCWGKFGSLSSWKDGLLLLFVVDDEEEACL